MAIVEATRRSPLLALGVSPRGSLALLRAAQAHAMVDGREYVVPDDVKRVALPALAHRVIVRARLERAAGVELEAEAIIGALLEEIPVPR